MPDHAFPSDPPGDTDALPPPADETFYRLKDRHPSRGMLPPDGHRYACPWLADSVTIHSDGNVSCGLDDPHARRSFGNLGTETVEAVFANPEFKRLQERLWDGWRCRGCSLYQRQAPDAVRPGPRPARPVTAIIETTVKCNLRCPNTACVPNNDPALRTRDRDDLPLVEFKRIVDQLAPSLEQVYFFNYGEPFFNRAAADMLVYLRAQCPDARIITSTNAIPLARRAVVDTIIGSLDQITVTLSGVRQASYVRYHAGGQLGQALLGLQNLCDAKAELGARTPIVTWRYLLFRWNDSECEIDAALALARLYGVDHFSLYLTTIPPGAASYRLAPGTRLFAKYRHHIDSAHGFSYAGVDADGLYPPEQVGGLGLAQWTGWRARVRSRRRGHYLRLSVSTLRPDAPGAVRHCFVRTGWGTWKVPLERGAWRPLSILIPWEQREHDTFDIGLVTFDDWFPIEEIDSADARNLGVLLRDAGELLPGDDDACWAGLLALPPPRPDEWARLEDAAAVPAGLRAAANAGRFDFGVVGPRFADAGDGSAAVIER